MATTAGIMIELGWESEKAEVNIRWHRVAFGEAAPIFRDFSVGTVNCKHDHSEEERHPAIGLSTAGRLLMAAHTARKERIRIISARELTRAA